MADLDHIRNKMVDYVILQMRSQIEDHAVREALTDQLQSQKSNRLTVDRAQSTANYNALLSETKEVVDNFLHCEDVNNRYSQKSLIFMTKYYDAYWSNQNVITLPCE